VYLTTICLCGKLRSECSRDVFVCP
jgi:hypothetical protein